MRLLAGRRPGAWQLLVWGGVGAALVVLVPLVPIQLHVVRTLRAEHAEAVAAFRAKHPEPLPERLADEAGFVATLSSIMVTFDRGEPARGRARVVELLATPEARRLLAREARLFSDWRAFVRPEAVVRALTSHAVAVDEATGSVRVADDAVEALVLALDFAALLWGASPALPLHDWFAEPVDALASAPELATRAFEELDPRLAALTSLAFERDALLATWVGELDDGLEVVLPGGLALWDAERALRSGLERLAVVDEALVDLGRCARLWTPATMAGLQLMYEQRRRHDVRERLGYTRWLLAIVAHEHATGSVPATPDVVAALFVSGPPPGCPSHPHDVARVIEIERGR